ncbi:MAG: hypothetical protein Q8P07_06085 [bacterium]|nr:hypothetical protein [bacterium]
MFTMHSAGAVIAMVELALPLGSGNNALIIPLELEARYKGRRSVKYGHFMFHRPSINTKTKVLWFVSNEHSPIIFRWPLVSPHDRSVQGHDPRWMIAVHDSLHRLAKDMSDEIYASDAEGSKTAQFYFKNKSKLVVLKTYSYDEEDRIFTVTYA